MRKLALVTAVAALTLSAGAMAAQSTSTQQPAAKPTMNQTSATHVKQDSTKKAAASASTKTTSTTKQAAWTKEQIKEAQEGLAKEGLYKGKATGVMDSATHSALKAYQKKNKLPVTGQLSDSVLVKLKSA
jgi:peptidoglycan hydrolase-like protein with peptidoglycan-binding domain